MQGKEATAHSPQVKIMCYLQHCLQKKLSPEAFDWLEQKCCQVSQSTSPLALYMAFSTAPRMIGKSVLALNETEIHNAAAIRPHWNPADWSVDQAARCLLLLAYDSSDADQYVEMVEKLFSTADARELIVLYQALPLLPHQDRFGARAAEGVRSNMVNVFHAIALNNAYPFEWFDEAAWNSTVLKVAFTGGPMRNIIGLDARANSALARMLRDLVHERRAANRSFPPEVWQLMAPYADNEMICDLQRALDDEDASHRAAAAAALSSIGRFRHAEKRSGPARSD